MKIICIQEKFKKAINSLEKITTKQSTLPILKNILIQTNEGNLIFSATNLEIGIIYKIGVKIEKEGKIIVPARLLTDFINNIPKNNQIELEVDKNILKINSGKYKAKINCMSSEDFPIIPECEKDIKQFNINNQIFKNNLSKNISNVNINDVRVEFTGINLFFKDNKMFSASTDTFRLVECVSDIEIFNEYDVINNQSVIIPVDTIKEVIKILNDNENIDKIDIIIKDNQIFFNINNIKLVSRIINGKYPDYKQIIPDSFKIEILLNRNELLQAVKNANIFTKSGDSKIKIKITKNKLIIKAVLQEMGENEIEIDIENENKEQEIVINPKFLIDGLNIISEDNIKLSLNDNISPIRLKAINNKNETVDNYINIIMPIRE